MQAFKKMDMDKKQQELDNLKAKYGLNTPDTQSGKKDAGDSDKSKD